jgi:hypothetical protein
MFHFRCRSHDNGDLRGSQHSHSIRTPIFIVCMFWANQMLNKPHTEFTEVPSVCFMGLAGQYFPCVALGKYLGVSSSWYFDHSWQGPLTWLCVYFWLTNINLAILNSICKSRVKSMTILDDFQFLPSIYTNRLSVYVYSAVDYLSLHDNNHHAWITCYHLPPSKMCHCGQCEKWLTQRITLSLWYTLCAYIFLRTSDLLWHITLAFIRHMIPLKNVWAKIATHMYHVCSWQLEDARVGMQTIYQWQPFTSFVSLPMKY